jgi:hypothetical protein
MSSLAVTYPFRLMLRPKSIPPHLRPAWEAFSRQAERVENARRALLACLPVGRVDPAPVPVGLDLLADELRAVSASMEDWRVPEVADVWDRCRHAVRGALAGIDKAHRVATTTTELEDLLAAVGEVVDPLDAWGDAERRWRTLRR